MKRGEIHLVQLDPTQGAEMQKTRPAVIVSPDELNTTLATVTIVPLTTGRDYPFRPRTRFQRRDGVAAVDQVRTVDRRRLVKRVGAIDGATLRRILAVLQEMFAE